VFLAGDAAHRVTPRGGTGLNVAFADGHDIGWKLGWVLRGWAPEALLDTYEAERRPVVQHNVNRSADPVGARRPSTHEVQVDIGGRIKHVWVGAGVSTLDLVTDGLTLLGPDRISDCEVGAPTHAGPPVTSAGLDPLTTRALGLGSHGAALLRPDGVPVATWSTPPSRALVGLAASALTHADPVLPTIPGPVTPPEPPWPTLARHQSRERASA
jgi:prepilin-type processing-associated H-X9-DG protein